MGLQETKANSKEDGVLWMRFADKVRTAMIQRHVDVLQIVPDLVTSCASHFLFQAELRVPQIRLNYKFNGSFV